MAAFDLDLVVVGGGSGGVRAARMAAQRGARVALVESGALGGTCVNVGCIPKKLYSYAAHCAEAFEESHGFGWEGPPPTLNWAALKANRAREITRLNGVYRNLLVGAGVQLVEGHGELLDGHTVAVNGQTLRAAHVLLATGGRPTVPPVPGAELAVTSDAVFDLDPFPRRLVVVGGGYIACEFASIFHGLGAEVTQVHRGALPLTGFDDEVRAFVTEEMRKAGVGQRLGRQVASLERASDGIRVTLDDGSAVTADQVLYATGRQPNTQGLGLDAAGVAVDGRGAIVVDAAYRTSLPSVLAVGDVTARVQLTPVALAEAMVVVDQLFGPAPGKAPRGMAYDLIPSAVFTHPNIGTVGLSEAAARARFGQVTVFRTDFKPLKHTLSGRTERTLMKLIVDTATDRVVGLHMVGAEAGEVVQGFAVAMVAGATKAVFDRTLGIHPTAAEEFVTLREPSR